MAASKVMMPDGSEENTADMICEDCDKPVSQHTCVGTASTTTSGGGGSTVVTSRSTGARKDPKTRPLCPHCNGAVHFSMPGSMQNLECLLRQMYVDKGILADPFARLPVGGIDQLKEVVAWYDSLRTPVGYGRMETAAGGAGTYSALRPKADPSDKKPRAKKQAAAEAGERIEDLAAAVPESAATVTTDHTGTVIAERQVRRRKSKLEAVAAPVPVSEVVPTVQPAPTPTQADRDERQARRRALLLGRAG